MAFITRILNRFIGRDKLSEQCILVSGIFIEESEGQLFFDSVIARFENFDQTNQINGNKTFFEDVDFITQCVAESLSPPETLSKFQNRVDSYFYIYRRIEEYLVLIKRSHYLTWRLESSIEQLKKNFFKSLTEAFIKNKGLQPNLSINNKDQLRKMNIAQYLMSITEINEQTINIFFAFSKLSFQSSVLLDDRDQLRWKNIMSNIKDFRVPLQEFMARYVDYELAFEKFPLDLPGFVELIRKNHPPKQSQESPFIIFLQFCKNLNLSIEEFFEQYQSLFQYGVKQKFYTLRQIGHLFSLMGRQDRIFDIYFSIYAASVDLDDLWTIFIYICTNSELTDIIQKHLISKVGHRTRSTSIEKFLHYTELTEKCLKQVEQERGLRFIRIFENIFDAFINKQLNEECYYHSYSGSKLEKLLKIGIEMSTTHELHRPSCLFIIRRLLFQKTYRLLNAAEKIKHLFKNLNDFDQDLCEKYDPMPIIQDEWLHDYLLIIPDDLLHHFTESVYRHLCDNHRNNRWTIYIWRRLIQLSVLRSKTENANQILFRLNEWLNSVKHNVYKIDDTLTIILVINLFELIIVKYTKSILSFPNIEIIIDFILHARQEQLHQMDTNQVDQFIQNAEKSIRHILLLQGKFYLIVHASYIPLNLIPVELNIKFPHKNQSKY